MYYITLITCHGFVYISRFILQCVTQTRCNCISLSAKEAGIQAIHKNELQKSDISS